MQSKMSEQEKIQHFREYDLLHFKNRRLDQKVEQIIELIQKTLAPFSKISLSFSGGKDSQLCLMLCAMAGIDFQVLHVTSLDFVFFVPGTKDFITKICEKYNRKLFILDRNVDFFQIFVDKNIYKDNSGVRDLFYELSHEWLEYNKLFDVNITGLRKMESKKRRFILSRNKGFEYSKKIQTNFFSPIFDLTNNDVYACITALNDEYNPFYYKAENIKEREWLRFNWFIDVDFYSKGTYAFLKKHYPEIFYKLAEKEPYLRTYV